MTISGLILMVACNSKSPSGQIKLMQKRVDVVERQVEVLYNQDFDYLVKAYKALDTTVARTRDIREEMQLLQAYLQQFETQSEEIKDNVKFSRKQLSDLDDDIKNKILDEQTAWQYTREEEKVLDVMEAQIRYFQEKFDAQKEVVNQLRKE
ncbi:MAG: hypothetical protein IJK92_05105 [Bacteroidales bacterium]|nr:hypothetical protein [Bacteroidales bacterium]